jgi:hypothetical protein
MNKDNRKLLKLGPDPVVVIVKLPYLGQADESAENVNVQVGNLPVSVEVSVGLPNIPLGQK